MNKEGNISNTIVYDHEEYRIISMSPSKSYALAQKSCFLGTGNFGAYMDAPLILFRITNDSVTFINSAYCPYDTLDGPFLYDIIWSEAKKSVSLCYSAIELSETTSKTISFS